MELRLEIKLASVEELAGVAKALSGLQVSEAKPTREPYGRTATISAVEAVHEANEEAGDDGMIEVESPFAKTTPAPAPAAPKGKAPTAAEKKAQEKADKKAKEDAERADRIARLKESMEQNKGIADQALDKNTEPAPQHDGQDNSLKSEPVESIVEEIKQLGDKLMGFTGVPLEAKQKLTADIMLKVGVPQGVRPTQLQQPMLGQFRDMYKASVNATVNPVMGGLV